MLKRWKEVLKWPLFHIFSLSYSFLPRCISSSLNQMQEVARRLSDYTRYHFAFEEALMKAQAYPGFAEHWRAMVEGDAH